LEELHDPELKDLASHPPDTIFYTQAKSTVKLVHTGGGKHGQPYKALRIPGQTTPVCPVPQYVGEQTKSKSAVKKHAMFFMLRVAWTTSLPISL